NYDEHSARRVEVRASRSEGDVSQEEAWVPMRGVVPHGKGEVSDNGDGNVNTSGGAGGGFINGQGAATRRDWRVNHRDISCTPESIYLQQPGTFPHSLVLSQGEATKSYKTRGATR
ncbi:hypothetical protein LPJ73_001972, partial [Coemansia sp. RSA 2703]